MANRRIAALVGLAGALLIAPTVFAAPTPTTITIDVDFEAGTEAFTTTGGLLCPSGEAVTDGFVAGGGRQEKGTFTFHIIKTLTCDDGSGSFEMMVEAAFVPPLGGTRGGFSIVAGSGTGDYAGLMGAGRLIGEGTDVGILDHYTGNLFIG